MNNGVMSRPLLSVVCFLLLVATTLADNVDCKIVVRDMYAADTQDAQNILVSMLTEHGSRRSLEIARVRSGNIIPGW